jgi:hypothetical protein
MMTSETSTSAHVALREATRALSVPQIGTCGELTGTSYRAFTADLAATLDAVADLLRAIDVGLPVDAPTHGLLTVAEHVDMGALMARLAGAAHEHHASSTTHLEPEPCATTDG